MGTSHSSSDSTMMLWVMIVCVLGAAVAEAQDYTLCYDTGQDDGGICMKVEVDSKAETIHAHMMESEVFDDVETLEDYKVGLAASKVGSQEVCFVRGLKNSFDDTVAYLKTQQNGLLAQGTEELLRRYSCLPQDTTEWAPGAGERRRRRVNSYAPRRLRGRSNESRPEKVLRRPSPLQIGSTGRHRGGAGAPSSGRHVQEMCDLLLQIHMLHHHTHYPHRKYHHLPVDLWLNTGCYT